MNQKIGNCSFAILKIILFIALVVAFAIPARTQIFDTNDDYVSTFVGSGFNGYVDGVGLLTMFDGPESIVADSQSNIFVWDSGNHRIRKITPDGTVSTFVGGGTQPTGVGTNVNLSLHAFDVMTIDRNDTIWMIGLYTVLYKITSEGSVTVTNLPLMEPQGICADSRGNLYISDMEAEIIYQMNTNNDLSVFVGSGNVGDADGNGIFTSFYTPAALACDRADNIYVWDSGGRLIRKIDQGQNVTTVAGKYEMQGPIDGAATNAEFQSVNSMCFDSNGNLILCCGNTVREITASGAVNTMAGSFYQSGYTNGIGTSARFDGAGGVCASGGALYISDSGNERIRRITNNLTALPPRIAPTLQLKTFAGLTISGVVGQSYQVQSSVDMTNWITQASILINSSPFIWVDTNSIDGNRFYRAEIIQ